MTMLRLLTWPFSLAARMIELVLSAAGRLVAFGLGLLVCALGVALCMTLFGALLGVPMVIFGGGMLLKSIF